jgi:hypothetical protein
MKANIAILVEAYAGENVTDIFETMQALSNRTGTHVRCDVNGVRCTARPDGSALHLAQRFDDEMKSASSAKVAFS